MLDLDDMVAVRHHQDCWLDVQAATKVELLVALRDDDHEHGREVTRIYRDVESRQREFLRCSLMAWWPPAEEVRLEIGQRRARGRCLRLRQTVHGNRPRTKRMI